MRYNVLGEWVVAHRRMVVSLLVVLFIALAVVRFLIFPTLDPKGNIDWRSIVTKTLDGLISTIVVSFVVAVTLWWTKPPLDRIPPGFEVPPNSISITLEGSATLTSEWEYLGHTGRYVRNRIFPILRKQSQQNNRQVRVRMMILDPRNSDLCKKYAEYRNRSRSSDMFQDEWTTKKVQEELIATVLRTAELNVENNQVKCELRFRTFLSQFRFDVSDEHIMVTQEDPQEPAFSYPIGSRFFDYYKRENQLVWDQTPEFDLETVSPRLGEDDTAKTQRLAQFLNEIDGGAVIASKAVAVLEKDKSPYA